ncbi:MAG TPA: hypothetical protein PKW63_03545 [Vicinamibacterales bacterium]|jgi:hypothetical protein|nr:hypothetical protein [Acidobacteriota bacterium]HQX80801.1 hypothetical protein [Vicinamibacterales bacterium]
MFKHLVSCSLLIVLVACKSSGGDGGTPTTPTPTNRAPVIASVTVNPTFGIADLQVFNFVATASDPDGDPVSYNWDLAGNARTGSTAQVVFVSPGGNGRGTVTVSDGRGLTASSGVDFIVGSAAGNWTVTVGQLAGSTFSLAQNTSGFVTGTFFLPGIGSGNTDPAQPGQILVNGNLTMRVKIGAFTDFTMTGTMATTGRSISGTLQGSGFTGQPFTMTK